MENQEEGEAEGYASSTPTSSLTWIAWFCSLPGHEYFCEVTEDFIEDDFNLTGLASLVPFWKEAMEMVLDVEPEDSLKIPDVTIVESSAELLYGLVHQRYILTRPGLQAMIEKYEAGHFGTCPRVYCHSTHVAPCGRTDLPGLDTVKLYCPNCNDIYTPPSSRFLGVDGAFFGTTFPHLLFQTFRELAPAPYCPPPVAVNTNARSPGATQFHPSVTFVNPNINGGQKMPAGRIYYPKIYGFRVSDRARSGPRMMWLRMRPQTAEELDRVDHKGRWIEDEFEEESDHEAPGGRHTSSLFEGADDEDENDEEEEEEDEPPSSRQPPPPPPNRSGGRQRYHMPMLNLAADDLELGSDEDDELVEPPRPPRPRPFKRRVLPLALPAPAPSTTETDAGGSSSAASSSAVETPQEDGSQTPRQVPRKAVGDVLELGKLRLLDSGPSVADEVQLLLC